MTTNHKPATALPSLARVSGGNSPFTLLGAIVPSGAPMRALIQIQDEHTRLIAALRDLHAAVRRGAFDISGPDLQADSVAADALLRELGE